MEGENKKFPKATNQVPNSQWPRLLEKKYVNYGIQLTSQLKGQFFLQFFLSQSQETVSSSSASPLVPSWTIDLSNLLSQENGQRSRLWRKIIKSTVRASKKKKKERKKKEMEGLEKTFSRK